VFECFDISVKLSIFDNIIKNKEMHELSIVMNIIEIAKTELEKAHLKCIETIELDVGSLSCVEIEALNFAWEISVSGTILEKSTCKINQIEAKAKCFECEQVFKTDSYYNQCPICNEFCTEIVSGRELRIKSLVAF